MTKTHIEDCFKVLLLGDPGTGKSSLLSRLTKNTFHCNDEPSCGLDGDTLTTLVDGTHIKTEMWELSSREKYRNMATSSLLHDTDCILLVYDLSNDSTFHHMTEWLKDIRAMANPTTIISLIGNKSDLESRRAVPATKAQQWAADHQLSCFIETSAYNASNVKETLDRMVTDIYAARAKTIAVNPDTMAVAPSIQTSKVSSEAPFQMVLVDINKAAWEKQIVCVEKPLSLDKDQLKFVALSYRWGEVPEQCVDTRLGYVATITSFHLEDFYELCELLSREPELRTMDYVWVDAICVDQANKARRKATVYHMSDIYTRANAILAVPDLHLRYLSNHLGSRDTINTMFWHSDYLYQLMHGKTNQLVQLDEAWLDENHIPKDQASREKLAHHTDLFVDRLADADADADAGDIDLRQEMQYDRWKQLITNRNREISQAMAFLAGLITEWSSRAWVISEYHIAKTKKSLKFWFLSIKYVDTSTLGVFHFDFESATMPIRRQRDQVQHTMHIQYNPFLAAAEEAYLSFEQTMTHQLIQQSFLEMMLKSKATKNEDRFYAVLPTSKYKEKLVSKEVVESWKISSMISVKLRLYEWMHTKDKLDLLFLSAMHSHVPTLAAPAFATLDITWPDKQALPDITDDDSKKEEGAACNFDLESSTTLQLLRVTDHHTLTHKLTLVPQVFYSAEARHEENKGKELLDYVRHSTHHLWDTLLGEEHDAAALALVCLPMYHNAAVDPWPAATMPKICLVGSFKHNKWLMMANHNVIIEMEKASFLTRQTHLNHHRKIRFDIY